MIGREFTMLGTLTYFIPMCVSVLMTMNRFFILIRPTDQRVFGQKRIFFYCFLILILCFTLLIIPRLSYCPVNFLASTLVFLTACAPERHPVTKFTNINAIWVPTTLLFINVIMMLYLKSIRYDIFSRIRQKSSVISMSSSNSLAQSQIRREHMLMRQTVAITVGLSFYEVGSLLMRTFPDTYNSLPQEVRDLTFYFRLETICAINFIVYYLGSPSTRKMLKKLTLRQVCRDFRNFIDDLNDSKLPDSKFTKIEIISEKNENKILFDFLDTEDSFNRIEYSGMENSRSFNKKIINLENSNIVDVAIRDLELILKFQKSFLECLSFSFSDFSTEDDSSIRNLPTKLYNMFHVTGRKIKTKKFTVKAHHQFQIMSVLPLADPGTLEFIDLYSLDDDMEVEIDEIAKTEQWKKAKIFRSEFHLLNANVEDICHFSSCALKTSSITARDLDFLKKTYISFSTFEISYFELKNFNENDEISNLWGPASESQWYFRMKDSEDKILRIVIRQDYDIQFDIVKKSEVRNGAIVHNYREN
ncbi:hypothetical protein B9Z55_021267 [Caenorhabditis nigoni]|nr:hypothetical protein B9Z55_021267 [Caenorhabditis nigoni]